MSVDLKRPKNYRKAPIQEPPSWHAETVRNCKHELETHSVTEVNGAGVQREYWQQCVKCGEIFDPQES